jgi:glycogen debranching enzyme
MKSFSLFAALLPLLWAVRAAPQAPPPPTPISLPATPYFSPEAADLPRISQETIPSKPFSVLGPRGCVLGQQDGGFEAWIFPWKILSGMTITADMQDYPVPIPVNEHAANIDVQPHATTITYSHANFTIRQIMIAPRQAPPGMAARDFENTGAMVFYQIQAVRPMTLTFSFHPVMQRMWPADSPDAPSPEWISNGQGSGFYLFHIHSPNHAAGLAMPGAQPGILAPYQERASTEPLQFVLHFDPRTDSNKLYPLLLTFADGPQAADKTVMAQSLSTLNAAFTAIFQQNEMYYRNLLATHTSIDTPDPTLNAAFTWGIAAIDQLKVKTTPGLQEEALTAGFVASGDLARPGFGWYFGRDALWSLYAVDSYGDFSTFREEMEFLLKRQSPDGKIMHEWAQTATLVDWASLPYEGASSDATTLLPMVMNDYLQISGDTAYITAHWEQLQRAWQFETGHTSPDGIYNNSQGSGWVESWIPAMPHQEIYQAALDQQASTAFAKLARATGHADLAQQAEARAVAIAKTIEREYYLPQDSFYAFSHNDNNTTDNTATIFPSVAWWDGTFSLDRANPMFQRWASAEFSTDWGTRLLSDKTSFYDPISYHQGTVWPLFTGWVSVAEYRAGHPLSGYAHLMQNVDLTWAQDPGSVTELLSGQFYQVLGRSTAHQLWSSAMVISPILRGMFGIEWNAPDHTLSVTPHLPADWDHATLRRLPVGSGQVDLTLRREGNSLAISASGPAAETLHLASRAPGARTEKGVLRIPLPPVEVYVAHALPTFGSETHQMKILDEQLAPRSLHLLLAAPAGSSQTLSFRANQAHARVAVDGAQMQAMHDEAGTFTVVFPAAASPASGPSATQPYVQQAVTLRW